MAGLGFAEVLMLAVLSGGIGSTDLVAMVQPTHYFQTRQIDVTIDKMVELAGRDPKDPKTQIQQLVALRHLADEAEQLKKSANYAAHRKALQEIADGKRATDPLGFAQDYARRLLAKLDGAKLALPKIPPIREDALIWFPAGATFAAALDLRQAPASANDPLKEVLKLMPDHVKKEMYDHIEKSGNVRAERVAFAFVEAANRGDQKIFIRFTGKANQAWLGDMVQEISRGSLAAKKLKAADDTPIIRLQEGDRAPVILLIGNTDLLMVGYDKNDGKHDDLVDECLLARSGKKPNVAAGALKDRLAKIPDKAIAFAIGDVPDEVRRSFRFVLDPAPAKVTASIERMPMGMDVQVQSMMANRDDADKLVQKVASLRKEGIAGLRQAMQSPLPPGAPPVPFQALINVVESLQVQSDADKVQVRAFVPDGLLQQIGQMGMFFANPGRIEKAPPKEEKK